MKFRFTKMHGCGNDFLILDQLGGDSSRLYEHEIQFLCDRHFGVGADGLVILQPSEKANAQWHFFNCNGSEAEMCGNAARCVIRYLSDRYYKMGEVLSLETRVGIIRGQWISDNIVEITLLPTKIEKVDYEPIVLKIDDLAYELFKINTGVPHVVLEVKDLYTFPVNRVGKTIQKHAAFQPEETNVTFFQHLVGNRILSTTFERGVERETFACGTGVAAAALIYTQLYMQSFPVEVNVPGGDLVVDLSPVSQMLLLRGPADIIFVADVIEIPHRFEIRGLFNETVRKR